MTLCTLRYESSRRAGQHRGNACVVPGFLSCNELRHSGIGHMRQPSVHHDHALAKFIHAPQEPAFLPNPS